MKKHRKIYDKSLFLPWLVLLLAVELVVAIIFQLGISPGILVRQILSETTEDIALEKEIVPLSTGVEEVVGGVIPVEAAPLDTNKKQFIEVTDSCSIHYGGDCLIARSAPTTTAKIVVRLRTGMVLQVSDAVSLDGRTWHKVVFDEWLRYPERVEGDWYVAGDFVEVFYDDGIADLSDSEASTTKRITIDRSSQTLVAYDGDDVFMEAIISTGLELTPTPRGNFKIFRKTPTRYMQGPLPYLADKQTYDLPGVPWTLYFTEGGAAIHGTYWHDNFGSAQSHGCVNMSPSEAKKLYGWADLGTKVLVQD
jgi:hypothetical protein